LSAVDAEVLATHQMYSVRRPVKPVEGRAALTRSAVNALLGTSALRWQPPKTRRPEACGS
jgi:hypothetical protein